MSVEAFLESWSEKAIPSPTSAILPDAIEGKEISEKALLATNRS
jgi:hypothetical protein